MYKLKVRKHGLWEETVQASFSLGIYAVRIYLNFLLCVWPTTQAPVIISNQ